ncbi:MAG: preprotein translocase subunit SecE [Candidatus Harrisonbacteria bacterium]|nr:preprotein translocase subunit SecE [Candidatus Harrisonbacteria bacterium]MBI2406581.1 preprotein translocase subunit SecE [Candidatus Harrisonbacteria bacterium]MBI2604331.1 preprotein translocase subunit SecE [Candidatus Harrisonbacteria bacterium]
MEKLKLFFAESKLEFQRVNWPSFQETTRLTLVVIVMSLGIAVFLGVFDYLFSFGLSRMITP